MVKASSVNGRSKRKWLRFSLRTLLCVPVAFGVIWWWATWPDRTFVAFRGVLNTGDNAAIASILEADPSCRVEVKTVEDSLRIVLTRGDHDFTAYGMFEYRPGEASMQPIPCSVADLLLGHRSYAAGDLCFRVERGAIKIDYLKWEQMEMLDGLEKLQKSASRVP